MAGRIPGMSGPLPRAVLVVLAGRCWPAGRSLETPGLDIKVLRTIGNFPRSTSVRDMHVAFQIPYVYDYVTVMQAASRSHPKS
jgi:hypothetical protein